MKLEQLMSRYVSLHPEESGVAERFVELERHFPFCYHRDSFPGHITGSGWVLSPDLSHVLLLHHRKLDKWLQPGGHADGDDVVERVALREIAEETGVIEIELLGSSTEPLPFDLDIHRIPANTCEPEHEHYDMRYLFRAKSRQLAPCVVETKGADWFPLEQVAALNGERAITRMIEKTLSLSK
ncbi:MAG: NUDIX hydrolase [Deltaproteobacteria bacterium]|nr:NUDIX hydrolase [Deltaproteobacteria bacterium]